jgi:uncharacterized protein with FMN-binding domain
MTQVTPSRKSRIQASIALVAFSATIVVAATVSHHKTTAVSHTAPAPVPASTRSVTNTNTVSSAMYKDGTFNATGSYDSPGGKESLQVSLTLSNDVVTASSVISQANDPTATSYQTLFISGYKSRVIGKSISSIKLTNVSGSSLTSQGFDDALKQIENQAKA